MYNIEKNGSRNLFFNIHELTFARKNSKHYFLKEKMLTRKTTNNSTLRQCWKQECQKNRLKAKKNYETKLF